MGEEFRIKGANVQLGPGLNVARIPQNGRNYEYISGEDPFLGAKMAVAAISGIQDKGIIATAKHFINNNQETNRDTVNEVRQSFCRIFEIYETLRSWIFELTWNFMHPCNRDTVFVSIF